MLRQINRAMTNEQEIATFITEQVRAAQRISGAKLGYALSLPVPDFRQRFGALRSFVEKFCADTVGVIPPTKQGDVIYVPASMLSGVLAETPRQPEPADSAWRAFAGPNSSSTLCINTESGDFRVRLKTDPEPSSPWLVVPPVLPEDHRQIASEFLAGIAPEDRSAFEEIL
jgi:hypothetical protein